MRQIKFRGKSKMAIEELDAMGFEHENGWFVGNFIMHGERPYIVGDLIEVDAEYVVHDFWVPVIPESVGQYTGLKDKNGTEIYERDIINHKLWTLKDTAIKKVVFSRNGGFVAENKDGQDDLWDCLVFDGVVIGNIYENPELLEVD